MAGLVRPSTPALGAVKTWMPGQAGHDGVLVANASSRNCLSCARCMRHLPDRGRGRGRPAGIAGAAILAPIWLSTHSRKMSTKTQRAHVARLLLAPDDLGLLEARQFRHQRLGRERIELLDAQQIDVVDAALLALLVEIVIDLAGAQHDAADLVVGDELDLLVRQQSARRPTAGDGTRCPAPSRRAATPRACGAAATSASSGSAACGSRA